MFLPFKRLCYFFCPNPLQYVTNTLFVVGTTTTTKTTQHMKFVCYSNLLAAIGPFMKIAWFTRLNNAKTITLSIHWPHNTWTPFPFFVFIFLVLLLCFVNFTQTAPWNLILFGNVPGAFFNRYCFRRILCITSD